MTNEFDAQGLKQGRWVTKMNNYHAEGSYKNDKEHGYWIIRHDDGLIEEGPYYEGERVGEWTSIDPDSRRIEKVNYDA